MKKIKINCVSIAFTFSDSSRVSWNPTEKIKLHKRWWNVAVSIPAPLGGYANKRFESLEMPTQKASHAFIIEMKNERSGLKMS